MSKSSHMKAVIRRRRTKRNHAKKYSRKEMQELMPGFRGQTPMHFNGIFLQDELTINDQKTHIWVRLDKNAQICDCARIGNVFNYLKGRCPAMVNWEYWFASEIEKL